MAEPVIIEAAINGVTSKAQNPNTPKEPAEIAEDALRCFAAGATVVHNHIDSFGLEGNRAAERYLEGWRPALGGAARRALLPDDERGRRCRGLVRAHRAAGGVGSDAPVAL